MSLNRRQLRGRRVSIPSVGTKSSQTQPIDFAKGWHKGNPNDLQPKKTLREVYDMRYKGLGKYETRKGCDVYTTPIGQAVNVEVTSVAGADDALFNTTTWQTEKVTATADGVLNKVDVNIKNDASANGSVVVAVFADNAGEVGELLAESTIEESQITSSYAYVPVYFIQAPDITNGDDYHVAVYTQREGTGDYSISTTTNTTNSSVSTDSGQSYTANAFSLNVKMYTSTAGGVKGLTRVYRPDGSGTTFFAHTTHVYEVDDTDGSTTSIDSTIDASATAVRFEFVNDTLYYVDGFSKPHKYDFTSSSIVTESPYNASHIIEHVGLLFYVDTADRSRLFWTNFGLYETFTSTDFQHVPAPKRSDNITALAKLNGVLYIITRNNKYMFLGKRTATFRLDEAYGQKGTFSQESVASDENFIYFASDDGAYRFNGTYETNIAEDIIIDYIAVLDKPSMHVQLHDNKFYIFYTPNGQAFQNECFVRNILYEVWEGKDLNTKVSRSFSRHDNQDLFLQGSNKAGVVYYSEKQSNDYSNLGAQILAEVRTAYDHFGSPQQKKRITYWRPIIETQAGSYSMQAGFSADYSDDINFTDTALQGTGFTYDDPASLYDAITYASGNTGTDTTLEIFGSAFRWQRVYKHHAAREPFEYSGEVLTLQIRRLR